MTNQTEAATPRPWHIAARCATLITGLDQARVADTDQGSGIGMSAEENQANAVLIVEAVNAYDTLREENVRYQRALQQLAENNLNDGNCASVDVAAKRVRNIAAAALAGKQEEG